MCNLHICIMVGHNQYNYDHILNNVLSTTSSYHSTSTDSYNKEAMTSIDQERLHRLLSNHAVTLTECLSLSTKARFLVEAKAPYRVIYANRAWSELTGYNQHDIIGGDLYELQGPLVGLHRISSMLKDLEMLGHCGKESMVNRRRDQSEYCCELEFRPVITKGSDAHNSTDLLRLPFFLATVTVVPLQHGFSMYSHSGRSSMSNLTGSDIDLSGENSNGEMSGMDRLNQLNLDKIPLLRHNSLTIQKKRSMNTMQEETTSSGQKSVRSELSCSCASHDNSPFLSEYCSIAGSGSSLESDEEQAAVDSDVLANLLMSDNNNLYSNHNSSSSGGSLKRRRTRTPDAQLSYQES